MVRFRRLRPGDEAALERFLAASPDTSMFLRSNSRAAGLVDRGEPLQATYVAALEAGRIVGVAAHCWNGMVLLQAPAHAAELARRAVRQSGRPVSGFSGPWEHVVAAREALGLGAAPAARDSREDLYSLDLAELAVPAPLAARGLRCRHPEASELELLTEWRASFAAEALHAAPGPELLAASRGDVRFYRERGLDWVLLDGPTPVAYAVFNAVLPDVVQIGGVWTPPGLRGRGYGRAVVAGALVAARADGVRRAVLFTDPGNAAARRAYAALGFRAAGRYGLVLLAP